MLFINPKIAEIGRLWRKLAASGVAVFTGVRQSLNAVIVAQQMHYVSCSKSIQSGQGGVLNAEAQTTGGSC